MNKFQISKLSDAQVDELALLFNEYRIFYGQKSDLQGAKNFIRARVEKQDSMILIATTSDQMLGFTQLYPTLSSVSMASILILNDLFVCPKHRSQGIAKALMKAGEEYAREVGAIRLVLSTHRTNLQAQSLYLNCGYKLDNDFLTFELDLSS